MYSPTFIREIKNISKCIVELDKHGRFFKNTREIDWEAQGAASEVFLKIPNCVHLNSWRKQRAL